MTQTRHYYFFALFTISQTSLSAVPGVACMEGGPVITRSLLQCCDVPSICSPPVPPQHLKRVALQFSFPPSSKQPVPFRRPVTPTSVGKQGPGIPVCRKKAWLTQVWGLTLRLRPGGLEMALQSLGSQSHHL